MPENAWKRLGVGDERGTILVVTVVAMLILGILAISFTALGDLEARIGWNDVWEKQAGLVAEGGIAAVRNQIQTPADYTAFLDGRIYSCSTSSCACSTGCDTARLATMTTGEFSVMIENDTAADPSGSATIDGNKRVILTAIGITRGATGSVMGRTRIRAWIVNDDPWDHVCASGDGVLCTDNPPNNANSDIDPPDPNDPHGPKTYPEIPRPSDIRCTAVTGGDPATLTSSQFPVPFTGSGGSALYETPTAGLCVMYPYYLIALTTPCPQCSPATKAYNTNPASPDFCDTGNTCTGMVRFNTTQLDVRASGSSNTGRIVVPGGTLGSAAAPATFYSTGSLRFQSAVGTVLGTIILHGDGVAGTGDLDLAGPHTVTTQGPACRTAVPPTCAYPLAILAYNPNEGAPPAQTVTMNISNNNVFTTGTVYTGGAVDFGPNTVNGSILGYTVHANNAATEFTYSPVYADYLPPMSFTTPSLTLPSIVAKGTWLQCRTADNLTDPCN